MYFHGGTAIAIGLGIAKAVICIVGVGALTFPITTNIVAGMFPDSFYLPVISLSPKEIFSNEVLLLDVDFFNPMAGDGSITNAENEGVELESTAKMLQSTIAGWYNVLRDIAVVVLLSVLIYIGIRILISSTSSDKAKYKQMIVDWVVAMCLLFVMQYIMSFSNILVDRVTDIVKSITSTDINDAQAAINSGNIDEQKSTSYELFIIEDKNKEGKKEGKKVEKSWEALVEDGVNNGDYASEEESPYYKFFKKDDMSQATSKGEAEKLIWPADNAMNQTRIRLQLLNDTQKTYVSIGYKLIYVVLVIFTIIFLFTYVKRVVYMAFLTIIAPLVAMTYPIDKINDGKAQAFDMWLKEYIFNLLIQPMHLVLYTILIGSAMDLAATNVVYVIVALGFMIPAEKLMRKFFGFEKAQTPGLLAGPAGAAVAMSAMGKLFGRSPKHGNKSGNQQGKGGNSSPDDEKPNIRVKNTEDIESAFDNTNNNKKEIEPDNATDDQLALSEGMNAYRNGEVESGGEYKYSGDRTDDEKALAEGMDAYRNGEVESGGEYKYSGDRIDDERAVADEVETYRNGEVDPEGKYNYLKDKNNDINQKQGDIKNGLRQDIADDKELIKNKREIKGVKKSPSKGRRMLRAGWGVTKFYSKGMANKISNRVQNAHLGRRAIRMAGGAALGATAATAGLAIGIAGGDPSKAAQYTAAAAAGGYKFGSGGTETITNALSVPGFRDEFNKNYYGKEEYKKRKLQEDIRKRQRDGTFKEELQEELGSKEEAKKYIDNAIPEYMARGINDSRTMIAMAKMEQNGKDRQRAIAAALISEKYNNSQDSNRMGKKKSEEFKNTIKNDGEKRNLKGQQLEDFTNNIVDSVQELDKIRYSKS